MDLSSLGTADILFFLLFLMAFFLLKMLLGQYWSIVAHSFLTKRSPTVLDTSTSNDTSDNEEHDENEVALEMTGYA